MADQSQPTVSTDRRTVLRNTAIGVAVAGVGVTAAACSSSNTAAQGSGAQTAAAAGATTGSAGSTASTGSAGASALATTSQVQVGSGFINTTAAVVVTQPTAGEYKAFTAVCTHMQCLVGSVSNNVIQCPCHGSQYSAKDGSVIQGPAPQPLAAKTIKVSGDSIVLDS
jgi:Rieske Fe-S protein